MDSQLKINHMIQNPLHAINISPSLAQEHEPSMSEKDWVDLNLRVIAEVGQREYLVTLLKILKGEIR